MAEISRLNRAGVRRLIALHPDARRLALRDTLVVPEIAGPLAAAELEQRFVDYLLDPCGAPLVVRSPGEQHWLDRCLLVTPVAPGNAVAIGDDIAAVIAAPRLAADGRLADRLLQDRFASRADDAIAAAVASLPEDAAVAAVFRLAMQHGPDEEQLHLALLQAGRALAWRPSLLDAAGFGEIIERLIGLLARESPKPLLDTIAPILGAIAATRTEHGKRVRDATLACFVESRGRITERRSGSSFLEEFRALDRARTLPDEDYYMTLPDRQVMEVAARVLGRATEDLGRDGFVALQDEILDGELGSSLLPSFVDGLIGAAAIEPLGELVAHLLSAADIEPRLLGLKIAAELPLETCADACLSCLDDERRLVRAYAARAAAMVEPERAVPALVARLDDPEPEVCAIVARVLVDLGQRDRVDGRRMPGELAIGRTRDRTAAVRAALADASLEVVSTLVPLVAAEAERDEQIDEAPLRAALTRILRGSEDGLRAATRIVAEVPDALPLIALALAGDEDTPSVALPAELRGELATVLEPIIAGGGDAGVLALETLSRFSLGDATMIDRIVEANARDDGYAGQMLSALAHVRRRSERAAALLAPFLESHEYLAATLAAAAVAGVTLPEAHALWARVRELYQLGSIAAGVAHAALVNRARLRCGDER